LNVTPSKTMIADFSSWWKKEVHKPFIRALDSSEIIVDVEQWLSKYPEAYRNKIRQQFSRVDYNETNFFEYEAFPKVELQFTEVDVDLKETPENTVKERQICGPPDEKKAIANAFINSLEKIASANIPGYCGDKDWPGICAVIEEADFKFQNPEWLAMDGSAFDTTVVEWVSRLVDELMIEVLEHPNLTLDPLLDKESIRKVLEASYKLSISVGRGAVNYQAVGRASGDGWTTFSNSMIMLALQKYCMHKAGIVDYFATAKGDDALCCVSSLDGPKFRQAVSEVFADSNKSVEHGLGFIAKFVKSGPLTEMDFISNHFFVNGSGGYRMTRIPARIIQTLPWSTKVPKNLPKHVVERVSRELCFSKGSCLKAWSRGLPIWEVLADKLMALGKQGKASEYNQYADEARRWGNFDDRQSYLHYLSHRYNLGEEAVVRIEAKIKGIRSIDQIVDIPELEMFYYDNY